MSDITDGIGTVTEGALLGRAVEPDTGEGTVDMEGSLCLNCGTALLGKHCHSCGQKGQVHRTISAFIRDLLHGALHFEGKIWHTLPLLIRRPGELTRRYIEGQRERFVSPMALFLFVVFLMFATFQMTGLTASTDMGPNVDTQQVAENLGRTKLEAGEELRNKRGELEAMQPGDPGREALQNEIAELQIAYDAIETTESYALGKNIGSAMQGFGIPFLDKGIEKWRDNPGLMLYKLQANFYKFSWLLIPLSVPFVWLLFAWRREYRMYDHAVFVTYSLSFVTLLFVILSLTGMLLPGLAPGLLLTGILVPVWHIRKQMRGAYAISRWGSIWRTFVLLFFVIVILALFLNLLMLLGITG